jgi:uncharacterized membrane protein YdjX (TVP38/TMEM64 family)
MSGDPAGSGSGTVAAAGRWRSWKRPLIFAGVLALAFGVWFLFRDELSLEALATREAELRAHAARRPLVAMVTAFAVYVGVTALSLPLATVLTLTLSWFFTQAFGAAGFWVALLVVSFGATAGSTLAFLLSRYLFRRAVRERFGERLRRFDTALEREGVFYLFTLRLLPVVPFFVVNLVMGLTPLRIRTFWWVSQLGMLPGTAAYAYAGSAIPSLAALAEQGVRGILTWEIFAALALLACFPLVIRAVLRRFQRSRGDLGKRRNTDLR